MNVLNMDLRTSLFCFILLTVLAVFIMLSVLYATVGKSSAPKKSETAWAFVPFFMLFVMLSPVVNLFIHEHQMQHTSAFGKLLHVLKNGDSK